MQYKNRIIVKILIQMVNRQQILCRLRETNLQLAQTSVCDDDVYTKFNKKLKFRSDA